MRIDLNGLLAAAALLGLLPGAATRAGAGMEDGRFSIDAWGTGQGLLPDDSVLAMTQTHDGYLWLGTLYGLARFDGVRFTVFDESNTPKLPSIKIVRIFEDSRSNLWVGTSTAGVALIQDGRVQPLRIGRGRRSGHLVSVCEDSTGAVWLLTEDGQLGRYANSNMDVWNMGDAAGPGHSVISDQSGTVWIGTARQIWALNPAAVRSRSPLPATNGPPVRRHLDLLLASKSGGFWCLADGVIRKYSGAGKEKDFGPYPWPAGSDTVNVRAACEDREGNLIVGTGGSEGRGVFWFDAQGRFARICATNGLTKDSVYALQADADGNLWVGLAGPKGGLARVRPKVFKLLEESSGSIVQSLCPDDQGGLWIGSKDKDFSYWKDGLLRPIHANPDLIFRLNPTAILVDHAQRVWAAARPALGAGLFRLEEGVFQPAFDTDMPAPEISVLFADHSDKLWVGTAGGLGFWNGTQVEMLTAGNGPSTNNVHAIAEDRAGDLWIGAELGGLNRLRQGNFTSFQQSNGFPSDNISSLYVDGDDVLWVGTMGNGLIRFKGGKTTHYWTENGLIANSVNYLIEDDEGDLWIGSNLGLMRLRKKELNDFAAGALPFVSCRGYDKRDGLPSLECSFGAQPAVCRTRDGSLWFPTVAGVVYAKPAEIHFNTNPPPVVIEQVLVKEQPQYTNGPHAAPPASVTVPAGTEPLEIHYTSLNLGAADRARFRYSLQPAGAGSKWGLAGNQRFVRYEALSPGNYTFQVCACNEDGVWNQTGASLAVTVLPFFWQTRSFLSIAAAALLAAVAGAVYFFSTQKLHRQVARLRQQQALETERSRIARDIHDQVGASLTQLSLLGEMVEADKDSPEEAQGHARQISQTARETTRALDEIVWTVNPSNDTLDGLVNYICKHAQDYLAVAGLRYRLDVPAELPKTAISPEARHNVFLAAKEAVTNVVKHARASEASLHLRLEPESFTLEIEDNGRGPDGLKEKAAESRNGLRNMRQRMEDVGGRFSIGPGPRGGTRVTLTVPLAKN